MIFHHLSPKVGTNLHVHPCISRHIRNCENCVHHIQWPKNIASQKRIYIKYIFIYCIEHFHCLALYIRVQPQNIFIYTVILLWCKFLFSSHSFVHNKYCKYLLHSLELYKQSKPHPNSMDEIAVMKSMQVQGSTVPCPLLLGSTVSLYILYLHPNKSQVENDYLHPRNCIISQRLYTKIQWDLVKTVFIYLFSSASGLHFVTFIEYRRDYSKLLSH